MTNRTGLRRPTLYALGVLTAVLTMWGCSKSSTTSASGTTWQDARVTLALGDTLQSIPVIANQATQIVFTVALPPGTVQSLKPNFNESLKHLTLTPPGLFAGQVAVADAIRGIAAVATSSVSVTARVAAASARDTVCANGLRYGPYSIGLDSVVSPVSVAPATDTADAQTLSIMNSGPFVICLEVLSPVSGSFSLDGGAVDVTHDCAPPSADFSGPWSGTYQCSNTCTGQPFGGPVALTVTQAADGSAHYTDDGGATYSGSVCGNEFRFVHNGTQETEQGRFTLSAGGNGEKRSSWRYSLSPYCGGECIDTLRRQ